MVASILFRSGAGAGYLALEAPHVKISHLPIVIETQIYLLPGLTLLM